MPDVDDLLRAAYRCDEPWSGDTEAAHREVLRRHRRGTVARRGLAASVVAAAAALIALTFGDERAPRGVEPADPAPTTSARAFVTPLEGRWTSAPLGSAEVRAAARAAGAPGAAAAMLDDLPPEPFRVVVVVRGPNVKSYLEGPSGRREVFDKESIAIDGTLATFRPFNVTAETVHTWVVDGDELTLGFRSTTEGPDDAGTPGEAWQRLLYDTASFTR